MSAGAVALERLARGLPSRAGRRSGRGSCWSRASAARAPSIVTTGPGLGLDLPEVRDQVLARARSRSARAARGRAPSRRGRPGRGGGARPFPLALPRVTVEVRPVASRRDLTRFIKLPWRLYRNEPNWVPPLVSERRAFLDRGKNPFFEPRGGRAASWPGATGEPVGRISAHVDRHLNEFQGNDWGLFGFFECRGRPRGGAARCSTRPSGWLRGAGPRPHGRADGLHHQRRVRPAGRGPRAQAADPRGLAPPLLPGAAGGLGPATRRWTSTCGSCGSTRSRTRAASTR